MRTFRLIIQIVIGCAIFYLAFGMGSCIGQVPGEDLDVLEPGITGYINDTITWVEWSEIEEYEEYEIVVQFDSFEVKTHVFPSDSGRYVSRLRDGRFNSIAVFREERCVYLLVNSKDMGIIRKSRLVPAE